MTRLDRLQVYARELLIARMNYYSEGYADRIEAGSPPTAICEIWYGSLPRAEIGANAHLIAAAPDLLAACRAARDWYGLDGDGISEPVLSQLKAAIYAAEASG